MTGTASTVLIIEDNRQIRLQPRSTLTRAGHQLG